MPICIECGESVETLTVRDGKALCLRRCHNCSLYCDKYLEYDGVQQTLSMTLMNANVFRHALFNAPNRTQALMVIVLVSCLLDAYVIMVLSSYCSFHERYSHLRNSSIDSSLTPQIFGSNYTEMTPIDVGSNDSFTSTLQMLFTPSEREDSGIKEEEMSALIKGGAGLTSPNINQTIRKIQLFLNTVPSLQLVAVIKQYKELKIMNFSMLPLAYIYAICEFLFVSLCSVWAGSLLVNKVRFPQLATPETYIVSEVPEGNHSPPLQSHSTNRFTGIPHLIVLFRAMCLSAGAKLCVLLFLVWRLPLCLIFIGDIAGIWWLLVSIRCSRCSSWGAIFVTLVSVCSKLLFRSVTRWAPLSLFRHGILLGNL
eukprot:Tbor_TRINITY_DN9917_c0_g1::TRINITY_DN9917_c0_g1_i1::g.17656::m.17656